MISKHIIVRSHAKSADVKTYAGPMLAEHKDAETKTAGALDNTLLPQAQDADLKTLLTTLRGHEADHLKMAQDIQAQL